MKTRIDYIDNVKGILILLVVLGHCIEGETYLKTVIYSFHMPAFFIISAILLNYSSAVGKNFGAFLLSRIRRLLIPYILFEFLGYLVQCFTEGFYENLNGFIFRAATFQVHTDVDWFLIGLFFGEMAFYFARKNKYIAIAAAAAAFIAAYLVPVRFVQWSLSAFVFLTIGYYGMLFFQKSRKLLLPCAVLIVLLASYFNVRVDINNGVFGNPVFYLFGAVSGTYLVITLCRMDKLQTNILNFWGSNSLIVMGTHTQMTRILWPVIFSGSLPAWIGSCGLFLIVLVFETLVIFVVGKLRKLLEKMQENKGDC